MEKMAVTEVPASHETVGAGHRHVWQNEIGPFSASRSASIPSRVASTR